MGGERELIQIPE